MSCATCDWMNANGICECDGVCPATNHDVKRFASVRHEIHEKLGFRGQLFVHAHLLNKPFSALYELEEAMMERAPDASLAAILQLCQDHLYIRGLQTILPNMNLLEARCMREVIDDNAVCTDCRFLHNGLCERAN